MKKPQQPKKQPEQPKLGIFWLVDNELVLASTLLDQCERYGEVLNESRSHADYWAELQQRGEVSRETEYEESPRGRVVYNLKTSQFTLMADRCILARPVVVKRICHELRLPKATKIDTDLHYRCIACLQECHYDYD